MSDIYDHDSDSDGIADVLDPDADPDSDGIPNSEDDDRDGDGVPNNSDAFPNDPRATVETTTSKSSSDKEAGVSGVLLALIIALILLVVIALLVIRRRKSSQGFYKAKLTVNGGENVPFDPNADEVYPSVVRITTSPEASSFFQSNFGFGVNPAYEEDFIFDVERDDIVQLSVWGGENFTDFLGVGSLNLKLLKLSEAKGMRIELNERNTATGQPKSFILLEAILWRIPKAAQIPDRGEGTAYSPEPVNNQSIITNMSFITPQSIGSQTSHNTEQTSLQYSPDHPAALDMTPGTPLGGDLGYIQLSPESPCKSTQTDDLNFLPTPTGALVKSEPHIFEEQEAQFVAPETNRQRLDSSFDGASIGSLGKDSTATDENSIHTHPAEGDIIEPVVLTSGSLKTFEDDAEGGSDVSDETEDDDGGDKRPSAQLLPNEFVPYMLSKLQEDSTQAPADDDVEPRAPGQPLLTEKGRFKGFVGSHRRAGAVEGALQIDD
jgi:hypothetical protein